MSEYTQETSEDRLLDLSSELPYTEDWCYYSDDDWVESERLTQDYLERTDQESAEHNIDNLVIHQSSPQRMTCNPLKLPAHPNKHSSNKAWVWGIGVLSRTPNGRMFGCCNRTYPSGRHGRYFLPKKRWKNSRRDHYAA